MKKIFFSIIFLSLFVFGASAKAQTSLVSCGSTSINFDNLISGKDDPEKNSVLVCLGKQILNSKARAKATIIDSRYGSQEIYIERSENSTLTGKVTYGSADSIPDEATKRFAGTFFVCPVNLDDLKKENPSIDFENKPGNLALRSYQKMGTLKSDTAKAVCSGTYFNEANKKNNTPRATFAVLLNQDLIDLIEDGAQVVISSDNKICDDESKETETECIAFFHSEEKDRLNNPVRSLGLRINKINVVKNGSWDIYSTIMTAAEKYASMTTKYFPDQYEKSESIETIEGYPKSNYSKFEKADSVLYVALRDGWVLEVEVTKNIPESLIVAILKNLAGNINDLKDVDISGFVATPIAEIKEDELATEEEIEFQEKEIEIQGKEIDKSLEKRLAGKIMIRVEANGEAYYIDPTTGKMYYLGLPEDAWRMMRELGIGITTNDIKKIPIGFIKLTGPDADGDGLSDIFEDAVFTDKNKADTDGDGYSDRQEIEGGFDPLVVGGQKTVVNPSFAAKQKGRIFLQVENNGEAWYVYPDNSKRYFLGRPADAFNVMRALGLGISDSDFSKLGEAEK